MAGQRFCAGSSGLAIVETGEDLFTRGRPVPPLLACTLSAHRAVAKVWFESHFYSSAAEARGTCALQRAWFSTYSSQYA